MHILFLRHDHVYHEHYTNYFTVNSTEIVTYSTRSN